MIYVYKLFNYIFWFFLAIFLLLLFNTFRSNMGADRLVDEIIAALIVSLPIIILGTIRWKLYSIFEVRKQIGEQKYRKAIGRITKKEEKNRDYLSNSSNRRNIDPLILIAKKELIDRKKYITPDIFGRAEIAIDNLRVRNDVQSVTFLYEKIIGTRHEGLNSAINDYLKNEDKKA